MRHNYTPDLDSRYEIREIDSSEETIYVRSTGSDSNDGKTSGTAFLTPERALREVPLSAQYARVIDVGSGIFSIPARIAFKSSPRVATGQSNPFVVFKGATPTDSAVQTVQVVTSFTRAGRIILQITGAAWVINEHVGKLIRFTSGAWNGSYARVKANDANTVTITCGKINGFAFPILAGHTFVFMTMNTEFVSPYSSAVCCQIDSSKIEFQNIKWNITGGIVVRQSTVYMTRSDLNVGYLSIGNSSFVDLLTCYVKESTTTSYLVICSEHASFKSRRGTIFNGNNVADSCLFLRNSVSIRLEDEMCLMNMDNGIRIVGIAIQPDWHALAFIDWFNCVEGIKSEWYIDADPSTGLPFSARGLSFCYWPEMYGTLSANFLVDERAGSTHYIPATSSVTTALGTNICTVDGSNEGYIDHLVGSKILGLGKNKRILADGSTTFSAVGFDYAETVANTNPTAITDITSGVNGQEITLRGGSNANSTTIAHGGNFVNIGGLLVTLSLDIIVRYLKDGAVWRQII